MEKKKTNKKKNVTLAVMAAIFAVSLMCSCGGNTAKSVDSEHAKASAEQTSTEQIGEAEKAPKRTVQLYLSDEEDEGTVLDFGSDSVFGGIEMETDEHGELIYSEQGGSMWYKITDSRFGTYNKLSRFARKYMTGGEADQFLSEADIYFVTSNGSLYFVSGAGGRTISSTKRYVMNGGSAIRVSFTHTAECRKKYGITRSSVDFVKSDGTWKLDLICNS